MIVVLADDLTGATELGGVAWRYGLTAEIHTQDATGQLSANAAAAKTGQSDEGVQPAIPGVLALDTDTRGYAGDDAARRVARACASLPAHTWLFKKIDSVLRGPVLAELEAALACLGRRRALVVSANPELGRTVRGGRYFVDEQPIHQTDFSNDPQYPRRSSCVLEMLGLDQRSEAVRLCRPDQPLPERGIVVGDASCTEDLLAWAGRVDETVLPVGGAEFFAAILGIRGGRVIPHERAPVDFGRRLFVCGSLAARALDFLVECRQRGWPVISLPAAPSPAAVESREVALDWARNVMEALKENSQAVMAIGRPLVQDAAASRQLGECLIAAAGIVIKQGPIGRIYVEGGATAVALVRALGWGRLRVIRELAPGIVTLEPTGGPGLRLTSKPGSYAWPPAVRSQTCMPG